MGGQNIVINTGKTLAFLKQFTAGLSGYLQVEAIEPVTVKGSKASIQRKTVALDKISDLTPFIQDHKEWNLYFRPNLLRSSQGSGEGGAAKKEDIIAGTCFHVDLDPVEPPADATVEAKRAHLEEERQRIKTALASFAVPPSFVIDSGGGYQAFWRLDAPVSIEEAEAINQRLCAHFDTPDNCWSIQHLMRLPHTTNWPSWKKIAKGRTAVPTKLLVESDKHHGVGGFDFLPAAKDRTTKGKKAFQHTGDLTGLPVRFVELLAGDEDLRKRWDGDTTGLTDPSRNGLDMSLTALAVKRGFNDAEIVKIHHAFPHGKVVQDGRGIDYIQPMIDKTRADRTLSRTEPWNTANRLIAERFTANDGTRLLRQWNGDCYLWRGGTYRLLDEQDIAARVWSYLGSARHFISKNKSEPFKVNRAKAGDVLGALKAVAHLDSGTPNPGWMDEAPALLSDPVELLVLSNGLLHMPSRALYGHNPRLFTTAALPYAFAPEAASPVAWLGFLDSVWGDDIESIETLQELFGYCLTTDCSQQKIPLVVGPKRSGKGTIARVLRGLIGEANCVGPTLSSLATQFGLEALIGKRLAIFSDVRLSGHIDQKQLADRVLSISGEDTLTIDRKYKPAWTGALKTRLLMFSNELPKILDDSGALSSRFIVLRMRKSFYGKEDTGLADRLLLELPAILNWALDGLERLKKRGAFRQPTSALELVQELEKLSSPIGAFIADKCVVDPTAQVGCDHLYKVYDLHCRIFEGWKTTPTKAAFGASLRAALPELERKQKGPRGNQQWFYVGVGLAVDTAGAADLSENMAEIADLDAARAKKRELLL
ncbi:phage/plasmid primase, P4 family [Pseudomonas sp. zbq_5]|uniref:phage/plasmid primase, P4 family n=1 Tax=unclassified Pseudomonas TaxID=196821 RepID=UPI00370C1DAA